MATAVDGRREAGAGSSGMLMHGRKLLRGGSRRFRRHLVYLVPLITLAAGLALYRVDPDVLQTFRLKSFDLYQQLKPRPYVPAPIKVLDLDNESLERLGQWPWPRSRLADMLARLFNAGAQVVAFDVLFAEPDRTSPRQVLPIWLNQRQLSLDRLPAEVREFSERVLQSVPDHDVAFASVIAQIGQISRRHGVVTGFVVSGDPGHRRPAAKFSLATAGDDPLQFLSGGDNGVTSLPEIDAAAAGVGSIGMSPDADNIVRRVPILVRLGGRLYPSLAAEAIRVYQGASTYIVKSSGASGEESFGQRSGINHVKVGRVEIPLDGIGRMWVHFTAPVPERTIPVWKIFDASFDPAAVEGQVLFFGTSAPGLKDLRSTPLDPEIAGVEVHAQIAEQMLLGEYLQRPDWARGVETFLILGLGLLMTGFIPRFGALSAAALGASLLAATLFGSWAAYSNARLLLDPVYPALTGLAVYLASTIMSYLDTEAERATVRGAFGQYLSPALVEQLAQEPDRLKLGGELKQMTFLFCDVRGFTSISEGFKHDPQGLTRLINRFLTPMTDAIQARQGTIDKYMGDCIMAFWNAPLDDPNHARHACDAALAMLAELEALNRRLATEAAAEHRAPYLLNIGIGLNTGECVVGNMGSERRFDYSVLGDAVNLASRLEGQSKNYGTTVVAGEETQRAAPEMAWLELDLIAVKGRSEAVHIYALLGDETAAADADLQRLATLQRQMLVAYRAQDWSGAGRLIGECRALDGRFGALCDLYDERVAAYRANPPGPDWDGVFVAESK